MSISRFDHAKGRRAGERGPTQILDIDDALISKTSVVDRRIFRIGDQAPIAAFGNAKAIHRCVCLARNRLINFGCRIRRNH